MNTSPDQAAEIIALLTASYCQPTAPIVQAATVKVKPSKLATVTSKRFSVPAGQAAKAKASDEQADGSHAAPVARLVVTSIPLPQAGTISAKQFFVGMRHAIDRNDRIRTIAAFTGFDATQSYSSNELAANLKARQLLNPPKTLPAIPGAAVSLRGFVASWRALPI
jgi:hypothetical protein